MGTAHHRLRPLSAWRRWTTGAVLGLLLIPGCSSSPESLAAERAATGLGEQVFAVGYGRIADIYLSPVDMGMLAVDGLKALKRIERDLQVERQDSRVRLQLRDRLIAEFPAPPADDARAWAHLTAEAVARARAASPNLRDADIELIYQAVFDGVTADLDVYSRYADAKRATSERAQREGYGGIGITVEELQGRFRISTVTPHGPAERAGLAPGDVIVAIDGIDTADMTLGELTARLRGPAGSPVWLRAGPDATQARTIPLRRERVIPNTVRLTLEDGIALLQIERFNAATATNLRATVESLVARQGERLHGFVLDLRSNPGGLLDQAVAVADLFMPQGRIISTRGRHPDSMQRFDATRDDVTEGRPLVVLVDGRSASAAEIVAAALQDAGRAVVVGTSSYGKGSVQTVTRLPNDGELFLTWSRLYAPSGYTLHRQGVLPTICTSNAAGDAEAVIALLRDGRLAPPPTLLTWRLAAPEDDTALAHLRQTCPEQRTTPADLDLEIARRLLREPALYQRALALSRTLVAEQLP